MEQSRYGVYWEREGHVSICFVNPLGDKQADYFPVHLYEKDDL